MTLENTALKKENNLFEVKKKEKFIPKVKNCSICGIAFNEDSES